MCAFGVRCITPPTQHLLCAGAVAAVSTSTVYARQEAAASILSSAKRHPEANVKVQRLLQRFPEVVHSSACATTLGSTRGVPPYFPPHHKQSWLVGGFPANLFLLQSACQI